MSVLDIVTDYKNKKNHNDQYFGIGHSHIKSIEYAISENKDFLNAKNIQLKQSAYSMIILKIPCHLNYKLSIFFMVKIKFSPGLLKFRMS